MDDTFGFKVTTSTPSGVRQFEFLVHMTSRVVDRHMGQSFYADYHSPEPLEDVVHHEMEIVAPVLWEYEHAEQIHFRTAPNGNKYVCWTGLVPDQDVAARVLCTWCLGTCYTMETGHDFVPIIQEYGEDFLPHMEERGYVCL